MLFTHPFCTGTPHTHRTPPSRVMRRTLFLLLLSFPAALVALIQPSWRRQRSLTQKRRELPERRSASASASPHTNKRDATRRGSPRFANPKAASESHPSKFCLSRTYCSTGFLVNGQTIPEVNFNVNDSWAGLLPISSNPKETRKVRWCACIL